ncbi:MAG: sigma-54 dependent transcriptional regulator [Proteobacteria bacterium]|nr:sigma-54 dependent transcriptional regulator [Pseudomonadota bacterium]
MNEKILIIEDEDTLRDSLTRVFTREGYQVVGTNSAEPAMPLLQDGSFDLVLTDVILPGISGIELLKWLKDNVPDQMVIIMTAYASLETAVETLRSGAYDYVVKPIIHEELKQIVKSALKVRALKKETVLIQQQITGSYDLSRIIGQNPEILQIIARVKKITETRSTVLIAGEVGTGKRLLARSIHFNSSRADKTFMSINLRAIPADLLETKLFGMTNEPVAGLKKITRGLLEEANGGTIYLSGIEILPQDLQERLLKALEDQAFLPPGRTEKMKINITVISSSIQELSDFVTTGQFREDLYRRLKGVSFKLPPLRDRKEDIEPLTRFFLQYYAGEFSKTITEIEPEGIAAFTQYHWPGNIRELRSIIERAALITTEPIICIRHLPVLNKP